MTVFIDLLRAVNVGGVKVPMADLRAALEESGLRGVETYVQSGNVVCETDDGDAVAHARLVHEAIAGRFGYHVDVLTLTAAELSAAAAGNPFLAGGAPPADEKILHVTFLQAPAEAAAFAALSLPAAGDEAAVLSPDGRRIYLRLPYGYGRTKLNNAWFERALMTRATTRNWRTVVALAGMGAARSPA
jgi:uncharacterized protein (DUF1697 family)